ncbi:hypothetical protein MMC31_000469 [Peltigera leucophlebia]|nr:hypothetical protein [Peltigera leucophlebia]
MSPLSLDEQSKDHKLVQDHKRERDHKYKWAHGEAIIMAGRLSRRPAKVTKTLNPDSIIRSKHSRPGLEFQAEMHPKTSRKQAPSFNHEISTSDSSAEEDVEEGSVAPEPDAGISYSFDAPHGPTEGRTILGMAFAEAVEKFETKELEKLVKDEYEVIVKEQDKFHLTEPAADADADGFELI